MVVLDQRWLQLERPRSGQRPITPGCSPPTPILGSTSSPTPITTGRWPTAITFRAWDQTSGTNGSTGRHDHQRRHHRFSAAIDGIEDSANATAWYNASWSYRKAITIDNTQVGGDLSDFPVLVKLGVSGLTYGPGGGGDESGRR